MLKLFLLLLIVLGFCTGGYVAYDLIWGAESHLRTARRALEERDFHQARSEAELCLKAKPERSEAHLLAAQAARREWVPEMPSGLEQSLASVAPFDSQERIASIQTHLAAYERLGGLPEIAEFERRLLRIQCGDLTQMNHSLKALASQETPEGMLLLEALSQGYLLTYRLPEARACLDLWLERRENVQALLWRGWIAERYQDTDKAIADYRRCLVLTPENDNAERLLAETLLENALPKEALEHFSNLQRRAGETAAVLLGEARCHYALGEFAEMRRLLEKIMAKQNADAPALIELANLDLQEGKPVLAEQRLRLALEIGPFDHRANNLLSRCLTQLGKKGEAETRLLRVKDIEADMDRMQEMTRLATANPHDPVLRFEAGALLIGMGHVQEGRRCLKSALQEDPRHEPSLALETAQLQNGVQASDLEFRRAAHMSLASHYDKLQLPDLAARHRRRAKSELLDR